MTATLRRGFLAALLVIPVTFAGASMMGSVNDLNELVELILKGFNNRKTTAEIEFTDIKTDAKRALNFGMFALYEKDGRLSDLVIDIPEFSYDYNAVGGPTVRAKGFLELELLKFFDQDELNEMGEDLEDMVMEMAKEFLQDFGPAATVQVKVLEKVYDAQKNLEKLKVSFVGDVDLTKLPSHMPVKKVPMTHAEGIFEISRLGASAEGQVVMNPKFYAFDEDQKGMKEVLDALLNKDTRTLGEMVDIVEFIDRHADRFLNP